MRKYHCPSPLTIEQHREVAAQHRVTHFPKDFGELTPIAGARRRSGALPLMARLAARVGVFELRYGSTEEASRLLAAAVELFGTAGGESEDSVRARWNLAEALAERGRVHEAISESHKVRTELRARGALVDAAIAAVQILGPHLSAGRESELASLTGRFVHLFRDAVFPSTRSRRRPVSSAAPMAID